MQGRVLFFTAPPIAPSEADEKKKLAHSPSYLAFRARQTRERVEKAGKRPAREEVATSVRTEQEGNEPKRARIDDDRASIEEISDKAISFFNNMLTDTTIAQLKVLYGDRWEEAMNVQMKIVMEAQQEVRTKLQKQEKVGAERLKHSAELAKIHGLTGLLDYMPPNEALEWRR
jgi:hypothetical protein